MGTILLHKVADYFNFDPCEDPTMRDPLFVPYEMKDFLRKIAMQYPTEYHGGDSGQALQVSTLDEQVVIFRGSGWNVSMWFQLPDECEQEEAEMKAIQAFGKATWESMGPRVEAVAPDKSGPREERS